MKKLLLALGGVLLLSSPVNAITWNEFWEPFDGDGYSHTHRPHGHHGSHRHCHNHYNRGYSHCHRHSHYEGRGHHGTHYIHGGHGDHYNEGHGHQIIIR